MYALYLSRCYELIAGTALSVMIIKLKHNFCYSIAVIGRKSSGSQFKNKYLAIKHQKNRNESTGKYFAVAKNFVRCVVRKSKKKSKRLLYHDLNRFYIHLYSPWAAPSFLKSFVSALKIGPTNWFLLINLLLMSKKNTSYNIYSQYLRYHRHNMDCGLVEITPK